MVRSDRPIVAAASREKPNGKDCRLIELLPISRTPVAPPFGFRVKALEDRLQLRQMDGAVERRQLGTDQVLADFGEPGRVVARVMLDHDLDVGPADLFRGGEAMPARDQPVIAEADRVRQRPDGDRLIEFAAARHRLGVDVDGRLMQRPHPVADQYALDRHLHRPAPIKRSDGVREKRGCDRENGGRHGDPESGAPFDAGDPPPDGHGAHPARISEISWAAVAPPHTAPATIRVSAPTYQRSRSGRRLMSVPLRAFD